jgi:hypothetical protein
MANEENPMMKKTLQIAPSYDLWLLELGQKIGLG